MTPLEILLIFLITLGFSGAIPIAKVGLRNSRVEVFTAIYTGGIVFTMFVEQIIFIPLGHSHVSFGSPALVILLAGFIGALGYLSGYGGMKGVHAGISSTVFNLQGPLILIFGALFTAIIPGKAIIIGLLLSVAGIVLIGAPKFTAGKISFGIPFILVILAPILWAIEWVSFSSVSARDPVFYTFLLYLTAFVVSAAIALLRKGLTGATRKMFLYAFSGGALAGIANASYGIFISSYGTALTGIVTIISVPVSVLLVMAVLRERYTITEIVGLVVIGVGLGIALFL
ncbi:MAG: DMT family transporter [Candidatus Thermoplasmatota archaeon]|jgi:drug/metabolite transporter (DMT)-like permease|nr:DMT family transporter [Candidatus Thermoplasmatota archaeon]MCL5789941.1 DMT family transporter [Candidatus Thermoplasmatota archaeon]